MSQKVFRQFWDPSSQETEHILVLSSQSMDYSSFCYIPLFEGFQSLNAIYILLLKNPNVKVAILTSQPIPQSSINFHLNLLERITGTSKSSAAERLCLLSTDSTQGRVSQAALNNPTIMSTLREFLDLDKTFIQAFKIWPEDREFGHAMGIDIHGPDQKFDQLDKKGPCRQFLQELGVRVAPGTQLAYSVDELAMFIAQLFLQYEGRIEKFMIKLNETAFGLGNSILPTTNFDLANLQESIVSSLRYDIKHSFDKMTWEMFCQEVNKQGVLAEEFIDSNTGAGHCLITVQGDIKYLETQYSYMTETFGWAGSIRPLQEPQHGKLVQIMNKCATRLQAMGYIDQFNVDIIMPKNNQDEIYVTELNLRQVGSAYAFLYVLYLTDGHLTDSAQIIGKDGKQKYMKYYLGTWLTEFGWEDEEQFANYVYQHPELQFDMDELVGVVITLIFFQGDRIATVYSIANSLEEAERLHDEGLAKVISIASEGSTILDEQLGNNFPYWASFTHNQLVNFNQSSARILEDSYLDQCQKHVEGVVIETLFCTIFRVHYINRINLIRKLVIGLLESNETELFQIYSNINIGNQFIILSQYQRTVRFLILMLILITIKFHSTQNLFLIIRSIIIPLSCSQIQKMSLTLIIIRSQNKQKQSQILPISI